ncbi:N-acetyltransferase [Flavihumibacter sp. ZG627]|uniref:GNAT family N-acetyltransferase n=1 Tax=Flavihumibacter sp. ZG627 TaxID=1463156 RepID=UPI00069467FD|nr:GNAT family N-acetyltransferase [Flavihumibacter sp. ZG627]
MDIRKIKEEELDAASLSLANAFFMDPLQRYVFPDENDNREKSPLHFKAILNYGFLFGDVYTTDDIGGAVVWLRPGETDGSPDMAVAAGIDKLPYLLGAAEMDRFFNSIAFVEAFHKEDISIPHWYTMVVGVDPVHQGKGYGRKLLDPVIEKAAADGIPVYLETAQPTNVSFYQHLGFRILRDLIEPVSGLRLWTFQKD